MHLILIALAAIANSIMDTVSFHYRNSIFGRLNERFWNPVLSWRNKYKPKPEDVTAEYWYTSKEGLRFKFPFAWIANFLDAWHLFKMLMLLFWAGAVAWVGFKGWAFVWYIDIPLLYPAWNWTFTLFYKYIWNGKGLAQ